MNFDEETLIEIEDYIQALDEQVGLKPETILDINRAITKQRKLVKNINYDTVLGTVDYEYEYLFSSDEGEPCPIDGWMPIATERIKHPEKIPEYIERGILRRIKPQ